MTIDELQNYPYLSFEQGNTIRSTSRRKSSARCLTKSIRVNDRATLFNLLIGLNGYTISTGVLSADLNGNEIIPVPLACDGRLTSDGSVIRMRLCPSLRQLMSRRCMRRLPLDFDGEMVKGFPEDLIITTHVCRGNYHSTWASSGGCGRFGIDIK